MDGKALLVVTGLLTEQAVLTQYGALLSKQFYNVIPLTAKDPQPTSTPAIFSGMDSSVLAAPDFLIAGNMELEYTSHSWTSNTPVYEELEAAQPSEVGVIAAATASSAAAGAAASISAVTQAKLPSYIPLTNAEIAYQASDFSPPFAMSPDEAKMMPTVDRASYTTIAPTKTVVDVAQKPRLSVEQRV